MAVVNRRRQPTTAEANRFYDQWARYLRRTVVRTMEQGGKEAWSAAVFRVAERFGRLRRWEKNIAIVVLASHALNAALVKEIERRAERRPEEAKADEK